MARITSRTLDRKSAKILAALSKLPIAQYRVMRLMVTPGEISYEQLCRVLCNLPEDKRLTQAEIDTALYDLIHNGYIASMIEDGVIKYVIQIDKYGNPIKDLQENVWNDFTFAMDKLDSDNKPKK